MSEEKQGIKFDLSLNLGHVIMVSGMIGTMISMWVSFNSQVTAQELRISSMERLAVEQQVLNKAMLEILTELRIKTAITKDQIDRMGKDNK